MTDTAAPEKAGAFRSLRSHNMRIYMGGLLLSNVGTWLQFTATSLLIYRINNRATDSGLNAMFQFLPMLLLGAWAGGLADRFDRRKVTICTQTALGLQAVVLAAVDAAGHATLPVVYTLSLVLGIANAIDNPARRGLVTELVPAHELSTAMSLNTTVMTGSRIVGPALAAALIDPLGTPALFLMNAVSYRAVLASLFMRRRDQRGRPAAVPRTGRPVREGLAAVWHDRYMRNVFIVFTVASTFAFNYSIVLPKMSDRLWHEPNGYAILLTMTSIGSVFGALWNARYTVMRMNRFVIGAVTLSAACIALPYAPNFALACVLAVPLGVGGTGFMTAMTGLMQQRTAPEMRSRMMALQSVAFLGSTPIGGPVTGWIGDHIGVRMSLVYGGVLTLLVVPMLRNLE
ncbi:MAG: MFS transporter [Actinomycetota bacterium]